jgi:hypothetical protein
VVLFHGAGLGLVAAGLGGCGLLDRKPKPPPAPDALEPLRAQAQALADRYDATIAAVPNLATRLTPLRDAHRAHVVELGKAIGTATPSAQAAASASAGASGSPPPADPQAAVAALRTAEEAAQPDAVAACLAAPAKRAGLVAAIAACRATHVEALR